jgi:hypothetical protein
MVPFCGMLSGNYNDLTLEQLERRNFASCEGSCFISCLPRQLLATGTNIKPEAWFRDGFLKGIFAEP